MLRQRQRLTGWQDRQHEIGAGNVFVACRNHPGLARPRGGRFAAAGKACEHTHAVRGEPLSDAGAHGAGRDDGDRDSHCFLTCGSSCGMGETMAGRDGDEIMRRNNTDLPARQSSPTRAA